MKLRLVLSLGALALSLGAQERQSQYAVILSGTPVARSAIASKSQGFDRHSVQAENRRAAIRVEQDAVKRKIVSDGGHIVGATTDLLNAIIVYATPSQAAAWQKAQGVAAVRKMRRYHMNMNRALDLINAPAAWQRVGGRGSAGAGSFIGVIDSGIDQTHPAMQDPSMSAPTGFPKCTAPSDCAYTNTKVVVARSYVNTLIVPDDPNQPFPDDLSARDRSGHGTAVAFVAAGATVQAPVSVVGTVSGVAPKAYLGNYKVFGSPGVYGYPRADTTTAEGTLTLALEDAYNDGMDVVNMSIGSPAVFGINDSGSACNEPSGTFCDPLAYAVYNAVQNGMTVVVSAGNSGDVGAKTPAYGSIESPGTEPSAITVGATTNSRALYASLRVPNGPANLQTVDALFGAGPLPKNPISAPAIDASTLNNSLGCTPFPANSLAGKFVLIQRGTCNRDIKVANAQAAGAIAVVLYQYEGTDELFIARELVGTSIPTILIGYTNGQALQRYIASTPNGTITLDPSLREVSKEADDVVFFSSFGPTIEDAVIKPELVAPGANLYIATQTYDPNGEVYQDSSGYTTADGTSFSAPMVAGAVALVIQAHPNYRDKPGLIKSAVVNTADNGIYQLDANGSRIPATVRGAGAGRLNVGRAVNSNVTVEPATLSFGEVTANPPTQTLKLTNASAGTLTLTLAVQQTTPDSRAKINLSSTSVKVNAGQSSTVNVSLSGNQPAPGAYEGAIVISGGAETLRVPYLYLVGDNVPANIYPLEGNDETGIGPGQPWPFEGLVLAKIVDQYGVAVRNSTVTFNVTQGDAQIQKTYPTSDSAGVVGATALTGSVIGTQEITATTSNNLSYKFTITTTPNAAIASNGVVNAASNQSAQGYAPGSYITVYGSDLSDSSRGFFTPYVPLSLVGVSVNFYDSSRGVSVPGHVTYVSPTQINVLIPWELQGSTSALMRISKSVYSSVSQTIPIASASPAFFEYSDAGKTEVAATDAKGVVISTSHPVQRGQVAILYLNGLGAVSNPPASGEAASIKTLSPTTATPTVTIGGQNASVLFSGLAPGYTGLYQVNVTVPSNSPTGLQPVTISLGGVTSKTSQIAVQ